MNVYKDFDWLDVLLDNSNLCDGVYINVYGDTCHIMNGSISNDDGPAIVYKSGLRCWWLDTNNSSVLGERREWYINGSLHRENGPAVEHDAYVTEWYTHGLLHRNDGPAVISVNEYTAWYINNELHRDGGPAIEHANGDKLWYHFGALHRDGGPAVEYANGDSELWVNDNRYTSKTEYRKALKIWKLNEAMK